MSDSKHDCLGPDPHSYANFDEVRVTNLHLALRVDFHRRIMYGHVDLHSRVLKDGVSVLKLDTRGLAIDHVALLHESKDASYVAGEQLFHTQPQHHHALGLALHVPIPQSHQKKDTKFSVRITYNTTENSGGVQWLEPQQTRDKKHPFVYTQLEAILARTLLPCQDTPSVKAPYSISVTCPSPLVAACSGDSSQPMKFEDDGSLTYTFAQSNPIPAYLIAIVCGGITKEKIGPRSSVWAEKSLIAACVHEFKQDTEKYIQAAEKITGVKYDWGTYDMVVLPAAFPYGGMENPNLTFLSSSLLAGDRSLTNVVAHEITHSWSGNYVTNANWSDFWLNEGFTVYIERLILGEVHQSEVYRYFEILCGYNDLVKTVNDIGPKHEHTKLQPNLNGIDPDDAFSKIPYEKGSLFLLHLEHIVGGAQAMRDWLKVYFTEFRTQSLTTEQMKKHFLGFFSKTVSADKLSKIDWDHWLHDPGLPKFNPHDVLDRELVAGCEKLAGHWLNEGGKDAKAHDLQHFQAKQTMYFLDKIITSDKSLDQTTFDKLHQLYGLSSTQNVEISFRYLMLGLKLKWKDILPHVAHFLSQHGRGLYVRPLYKQLVSYDPEFAKKVYQANKPFYHSVIRSFCGRLGLEK